jgi:hypothetical protein
MTKQLASRPQRFALLAAFVGTLTMSPRTVSAQASQSTLNFVFQDVPFFASGCGDNITGTATLHFVLHFTYDAAGGNMFVLEVNLEGATALGASGATYRVAEVTQEEFTSNGPGPQLEETIIENFHMISPGTAPNYDVHMTLHITINNNGEVTTVVDNTSAECRG